MGFMPFIICMRDRDKVWGEDNLERSINEQGGEGEGTERREGDTMRRELERK